VAAHSFGIHHATPGRGAEFSVPSVGFRRRGECWKAERGLGSGFFKTGWKTKSDGHPAQERALRLFLNRKYKYRRKYTLACAFHHRPSTNAKTYAQIWLGFFSRGGRRGWGKGMRDGPSFRQHSPSHIRVQNAQLRPHYGMRSNGSSKDFQSLARADSSATSASDAGFGRLGMFLCRHRIAVRSIASNSPPVRSCRAKHLRLSPSLRFGGDAPACPAHFPSVYRGQLAAT
jgi:hypothetical protein